MKRRTISISSLIFLLLGLYCFKYHVVEKNEVFKEVQKSFNNNTTLLKKQLLIFLFFWGLNFILFSFTENYNNLNREKEFEEKNIRHVIIQNLIDSAYFTFTTQSTVGYGDISPVTAPARVIAMTHQFFSWFILLDHIDIISHINSLNKN